jgi:ribosomal protein S21
MGEIKRRKGETFDALLRRFQRHIQGSGKLLQAKKIRFSSKKQNRNKRRESALYRVEKRESYNYLLKTGQLKEEPPRRRSR